MSKRVVIVGAGIVGQTSAEKLSRDGHDVVLVERDPDRAAELAERIDAHVLAGDGCSPSLLAAAGLAGADLLLAVTDSDEANLITALIAGTTADVPVKLVRLRSEELLERLGDLSRSWTGKTAGISPDKVTAERIESLLLVPHAVDVARLLGGRVVICAFRVQPGSPLIGKPLATLAEEFPEERILVAAIYRKGKALLPRGDTTLKAHDLAYFSTVPDRVERIVTAMGYPIDREQRVIIGGGRHVGRLVAVKAIERGLTTVVIRRHRDDAEALAVELPRATVLHGDLLSEDLLVEAGIEHASTFIAATEDQETNLVSSAIARRAGAQRVITLVDNPGYITLAQAMGIDSIASPRLSTVGALLRHVRGAHVAEVASLPLEAIEVSVVAVGPDSPLTGKPLRQLGLPDGVLVTAVEPSDGEVFVPGGDDRIPEGSQAVVFALAERAEKLARFLERQKA